jgi:dihydropteroate synthase
MFRRKRFEWRLRTQRLPLGERALILATVPIVPGQDDPSESAERALRLEAEGADLVALCGEPFFANAPRVAEGEELRRVVPVLKRLQGHLRVPLVVDTYKAALAEKAAEYGAEAICDPTGLTFDLELGKTVNRLDLGLILCHLRSTPENWEKLGPMMDPVGTVVRDLDAGLNRARRAGVLKERLMVDPSLGWGKRREQNFEILSQVGALAALESPFLVTLAASHYVKATQLPALSEEQQRLAVASALTAAVLAGVHLVRVDDVAAIKLVLEIAESVFRGGAFALEAAEDERAAAKAAEGARPVRSRGKADRPAEAPRAERRPPAPEESEQRRPVRPQIERRPPPEPREESPNEQRPRAEYPPRDRERPPYRPYSRGPREDRPSQGEGERPRREYPPRDRGSDRPYSRGPREDRPSQGEGERPRREYPPRDRGSDRPYSRGPREDRPSQGEGERPRHEYPPRDRGSDRPYSRGPREDRPSQGEGERPRREYPPRDRTDGPPRSDRGPRPGGKPGGGKFGPKPGGKFGPKPGGKFGPKPGGKFGGKSGGAPRKSGKPGGRPPRGPRENPEG